MKSTVEALLLNAGAEHWVIKPTQDSSFLDGRVASIMVGDQRLGVVGEIHPEVLNNFGVENPTMAFEINLEALIN
jgi:phenylalanyl-tRNA synthetase beta chain